MTDHNKESDNARPCIEEENSLFDSSNLTNPCTYTPLYKRIVMKTFRIVSQEEKMLYCPYSSVDNRRVKIGVVRLVIPFCKNEHTKNQNEALICIGKDLYFSSAFFIISFQDT